MSGYLFIHFKLVSVSVSDCGFVYFGPFFFSATSTDLKVLVAYNASNTIQGYFVLWTVFKLIFELLPSFSSSLQAAGQLLIFQFSLY